MQIIKTINYLGILILLNSNTSVAQATQIDKSNNGTLQDSKLNNSNYFTDYPRAKNSLSQNNSTIQIGIENGSTNLDSMNQGNGYYGFASGADGIFSTPIGHFSHESRPGFGFNAKLIYLPQRLWGFFFNFGYINWPKKYQYHHSNLFLEAGLREYLSLGDSSFYIIGAIGLHIFNIEEDFMSYYDTQHYTWSNTDTELGGSIGVGYECKLYCNIFFDAGIKYTSLFTEAQSPNWMYFGFDVGVNIGLANLK
jgi:hypothetical protein